jgi:hypothetical protein
MAVPLGSTAGSTVATKVKTFAISADDLDEFGALLNELLSCYQRKDTDSLSAIFQRLRFIHLRIHGA